MCIKPSFSSTIYNEKEGAKNGYHVELRGELLIDTPWSVGGEAPIETWHEKKTEFEERKRKAKEVGQPEPAEKTSRVINQCLDYYVFNTTESAPLRKDIKDFLEWLGTTANIEQGVWNPSHCRVAGEKYKSYINQKQMQDAILYDRIGHLEKIDVKKPDNPPTILAEPFKTFDFKSKTSDEYVVIERMQPDGSFERQALEECDYNKNLDVVSLRICYSRSTLVTTKLYQKWDCRRIRIASRDLLEQRLAEGKNIYGEPDAEPEATVDTNDLPPPPPPVSDQDV
jgi:hypothetical protein